MTDVPFQAALDADIQMRRELLTALPYILGVLCIMYPTLTLGHFLMLSGEAQAIMMTLAGATSLVFVFGLLICRGHRIEIDWVYPIVAGAILLVALNSLVHLHLLQQDIQSTNIAMVLISIGAFVLSPRWWMGLTCTVLGCWVAVGAVFGGVFNWVHYGFMMFLAVLLSYATFLARRQAILARVNAAAEAQSQAAMAESFASKISALEGVLPLCAWCRNIQTDGESWESLEVYLGRKSQTGFTHGICPDCLSSVSESEV
ncbi:MAG: hypothetical protein ACPG4A_02630 [Pseudomonadales bacterium]